MDEAGMRDSRVCQSTGRLASLRVLYQVTETGSLPQESLLATLQSSGSATSTRESACGSVQPPHGHQHTSNRRQVFRVASNRPDEAAADVISLAGDIGRKKLLAEIEPVWAPQWTPVPSSEVGSR